MFVFRATHSLSLYNRFTNPSVLQWLMKALLWNNESSSETVPLPLPLSTLQLVSDRQDQPSWRMVVSDGSLSASSRLVPPATMSLQHAVDLQDVITVTDEARLVVESTPPFCIVVRVHCQQPIPTSSSLHSPILYSLLLFLFVQHANKAFLECANLQGTDALVGRPVESIFRVSHESTVLPLSTSPLGDHTPPPPMGQRYLHGTIAVGKKRRSSGRRCHAVECRLQVVPVVDRSRRRKLTHHQPKKGGVTRPFLSMSHILIHVEREPTLSSLETEEEMDEDEDLASLFRSMENDPLDCSSISSKTDSASGPSSDQGLETVG